MKGNIVDTMTMNKIYDEYVKRLENAVCSVVKIADNHALLRKSSHEMDERLYYSIVLLAEVMGLPITTHEIGDNNG